MVGESHEGEEKEKEKKRQEKGVRNRAAPGVLIASVKHTSGHVLTTLSLSRSILIWS